MPRVVSLTYHFPTIRMDPIVHFEIPVGDLEKAKKFYGPIFGWKMDDWTMPDGSKHTGIHTTAIDEKTRLPLKPGAINGMFVTKNELSKAPTFAIHVKSIDDKIKLIEKAGGKVMQPKVNIADMGHYAYVADLDGNLVGLWEDAHKKS